MIRQFTLAQLQYFSVVASSTSLSSAATRLELSASALSTAMVQLENALGVRLFVRHRTRAMTLTPAGKRFAREVVSFLEHADDIQEFAQGMSTGVTGLLRVGVYAPLAPFRLPLILSLVEQRHAGLEIQFLEADLNTLHEALDSGECETALLYGLGLPEGLHGEIIGSIPPHVLVAASHPAAATPDVPISLQDVADEPFIQLNVRHSREYYQRLFAMVGVEPHIRHSFAGYETVRSFVGRGHGYTILNQRIHDLTYEGGRVVALSIAEPLPPIDVLLARPEGVVPSRRAQAFEDACRQVYRG
ncbi:LysR family transcriptional regulator [Microbacterium sp. PMB16]|uniref:LysR family transcriptional regulator n=1 Tax=Microbacterium sp. PMB16 TaxID=3120157 RepID=UPI003F4AFBC6